MAVSHINDIGTSFQVTVVDELGVAIPISDASAMKILFRKPDFAGVEQVATFLTDGTDGVIQYISIAGDLDQQGPWAIQGKVTLPSGEWYSDTGSFDVEGNLI